MNTFPLLAWLPLVYFNTQFKLWYFLLFELLFFFVRVHSHYNEMKKKEPLQWNEKQGKINVPFHFIRFHIHSNSQKHIIQINFRKILFKLINHPYLLLSFSSPFFVVAAVICLYTPLAVPIAHLSGEMFSETKIYGSFLDKLVYSFHALPWYA